MKKEELRIVRKRKYTTWSSTFYFYETDELDSLGNPWVIRGVSCIGGSGSIRVTHLDRELLNDSIILCEYEVPLSVQELERLEKINITMER